MRVGLADEIQPHSHSRRGGQFDNRSKCYFVETMRVEDTVLSPSPLAQNRDPFRLALPFADGKGPRLLLPYMNKVDHVEIGCAVDIHVQLWVHFRLYLSAVRGPTGVLLSRGSGWRAMSKSDVEGGGCVKKSRLLPDPERSRLDAQRYGRVISVPYF